MLYSEEQHKTHTFLGQAPSGFCDIFFDGTAVVCRRAILAPRQAEVDILRIVFSSTLVEESDEDRPGVIIDYD